MDRRRWHHLKVRERETGDDTINLIKICTRTCTPELAGQNFTDSFKIRSAIGLSFSAPFRHRAWSRGRMAKSLVQVPLYLVQSIPIKISELCGQQESDISATVF